MLSPTGLDRSSPPGVDLGGLVPDPAGVGRDGDMPAFHGRHRVRIGLDGRRPLRRTAAIPSPHQLGRSLLGKLRQLAHRPEETAPTGAVSPFRLTSRVTASAASRGRRPARPPAGPAHPPVRTQARGAGRRVARIVADGDRHSAVVTVRWAPPGETGGQHAGRAGALRHGRVHGRLGHRRGEALPCECRGAGPAGHRKGREHRRTPASHTPLVEAAPARPSTASRAPGIFRSAPRKRGPRGPLRSAVAPKRNRCVCAIRPVRPETPTQWAAGPTTGRQRNRHDPVRRRDPDRECHPVDPDITFAMALISRSPTSKRLKNIHLSYEASALWIRARMKNNT